MNNQLRESRLRVLVECLTADIGGRCGLPSPPAEIAGHELLDQSGELKDITGIKTKLMILGGLQRGRPSLPARTKTQCAARPARVCPGPEAARTCPRGRTNS